MISILKRHHPSQHQPASFLLLLVVSCLLQEALFYGTGAPHEACETMVPGHGQTVQPAPAPYTLAPNQTSISGGQRLTLRLEATDGYLEGFFIQARQTEDGVPEGTFFTGLHKQATCGGKINSGVTHSSDEKKNVVTVEWEPPSDFEGEVLFRASVVKGFVTYWTDVRSPKVTVGKRSITDQSSTAKAAQGSTDTTPPTAATTQATAAGKSAAATDVYEGCGDLKGCYGAPANCVEKKNCVYLTTYTDVGNGRYEFELKGKGGDNRYVAVGLSIDNAMGEDSVVVCASHGGQTDVFMTWNEGRNNINVIYPKRGLRALESSDIDGTLYCRFQRDESTKPKDNVEFNLKNERFHVLVSEGSITADRRLQYHGNDRIVSARLVNLGETSSLTSGESPSHLYRLIHGCLMIGAWVCAASCGILFARYYKKTWVNYKCCNIDQWFHFHRFFMISTWSLTIAAFVLIIVSLKEFAVHNHSLIGISSVILCFIQPFMALMRPHPGTKNRPIFNWAHWFVGNSAQILGITAIFFGFEIYFGEENWVKEVSWFTLIAFIAFHCSIHILLSISQCIADNRPKNSEVFPLKEFAGSRTMLHPDDGPVDAPHACFRKLMLTLYLIVNWLFTALLILLVVFEREVIEKQLTEWGFHQFWKEM